MFLTEVFDLISSGILPSKFSLRTMKSMILQCPYRVWVTHSLSNIPKKEESKLELIRFWTHFYNNYETCHINMTKLSQYKGQVFDLLNEGKKSFPLSDSELYNIQMNIEDQSMIFDEESMFKTVPNIIKILIRSDLTNAKDYLKSCLSDKNDNLLISEFGQYTIEALIVYVLCMMFNTGDYNSCVRVSSLIERLESSVRSQALLLKRRRTRSPKGNHHIHDENLYDLNLTKSKFEKLYPIGSSLVTFMMERKFIYIIIS